MTNEGIKISVEGQDVLTAPKSQLVVDSNRSFLLCDMRVNPKNYGLILFSLSSIPVYPATIQIYQQAHGYKYVPNFLTAWQYPSGTDPGSLTNNSTFGIGDIDASLVPGPYISMTVDDTNFTVTATSPGVSITTGAGSIRFYIFANDFRKLSQGS